MPKQTYIRSKIKTLANRNMVSFTSLRAFLPLLLSLLVIFSLVAPSVSSPTEKLTSETVKKICSSTVNYRLCLRTLRHDPGTKTLPLSQLTLSYVERTRGIAKYTISLLEKLTEASNDPDLKSRYATCIHRYKIALTDLTRAKRRLSSGSIAGISDLAFTSKVGPSECDDEFDDSKKYVRPAGLVDGNEKLATFGGIVYAMGVQLIIGR